MYIQGDFLAPANYVYSRRLFSSCQLCSSGELVSSGGFTSTFFVILNSAQVGLALGGPDGGGVAVAQQAPATPTGAGMMQPPGLSALTSAASTSLAGPAGGDGGPPDGGGWKRVLAEFHLRSCAPICIYTHPYLYK